MSSNQYSGTHEPAARLSAALEDSILHAVKNGLEPHKAMIVIANLLVTTINAAKGAMDGRGPLQDRMSLETRQQLVARTLDAAIEDDE